MKKCNFNKKLLALLLSGTISYSLAGCNGKSNDTGVYQEDSNISQSDDLLVDDVEEYHYITVYDVNGHALQFNPVFFSEDEILIQSYNVSYIDTYDYTTVSGDTLNVVSNKCGVNISQILESNPELLIYTDCINYGDIYLPVNMMLTIKYEKKYPYVISEYDRKLLSSDKIVYFAGKDECLLSIVDKCDTKEELVRILSDIDLDNDRIYENQKFLIPYKENIKIYTKTN